MVLNYGGISGYVIVFTMVPICKRVFKEYNIPWHLYLAVHSFGSLVTQAMLPGTLAVQNLIPMEYLGTTPSAAPLLGTATAVLFCVPVAAFYCYIALGRTMKKDEGFMKTGSRINETIIEENKTAETEAHGSFFKAVMAPIAVLIFLNVVNLNASFSLILGTLLALGLYIKHVKAPMKAISKSATSGALIAIGIASITGFASGGMCIALEMFVQYYVNMGFSPEVLHRLTAISSLGLDSLPHNGSVVNQMEYTRLTYAQGCRHVFWIACIIPFIAGFVAIGFYSLGII